jgi:ribonuclease HI
MAKKKKDDVVEEVYTRGLVLHSDGSCNPNPGNAGWGFHGYLFENKEPTRGTGLADYVLTASNYYTKTEKATLPNLPLITPITYFDGYGAIEGKSTNNTGELMGAVEAIQLAIRKIRENEGGDFTSVHIWTDSQYVVEGKDRVMRWRENGWLKPDGNPPANLDLWKEFVDAITELRTLCEKVFVNWNKGHDNNFGNEVVDMLAFVGRQYAVKGLAPIKEITESAPEGYWKYETDRHPFLNHRRMYYNTVAEANPPGEYCMGEHDKNDDLAGKQMANGAYAYVKLDEPSKVLEAVRNYSVKLADGDDVIMIARVDYIFRSDVHRVLAAHDDVVLNRATNTPNRNIIHKLSDELVAREHMPPYNIHACVNHMQQLKEIMDDYLAGSKHLLVTDLTPLIYESQTETKKGEDKTIMKLRPEFTVGTDNMDVEVNYQHPVNGPSKTTVNILLGLDCLDRNALRRLENLDPVVHLVTWAEEPKAFRFATIIKIKGGIGIWVGAYSNLRLIH